MSGHSKWHNIRVKKTAADAARGKVYTRHARLIQIAAKGGGDPATNTALRVALENARADNVPNANIERAIKKGSGEFGGQEIGEILYACYAPGDVACLIECLSDNRNRTLSNIKTIIGKNGGTFAETNAVLWMFARKGIVVARRDTACRVSAEEIELELIDHGAEDIDTSDDSVSITTSPTDWPKVRDLLKAKNFEIVTAGLKYVPTQKKDVTDLAMAKKLMNFVNALEEDDDVSEVHTNAEVAEEIARQL